MPNKNCMLVLLVFFNLTYLNCNSDHVSPNTATAGLDYLFIDYGCSSLSSDQMTPTSTHANYLVSYEYQKGQFILDLGFNCVCNSAFGDSVSIDEDQLTIFLKDTSKVHAKCICYHSCEFVFGWEGLSKLDLRLNIRFCAQNQYSSVLDTTLKFYNIKFD